MNCHNLYRVVISVLSVLSVFNFKNVNSEDTPSRLTLFCTAFSETVQNSSQLLQVFDIKIPPFEISQIIFEESWVAMEKAGVSFSQSAAKAIADALFVTVSYMRQEAFIGALGHDVALYLLSQTILTPDNAAEQGTRLADAILNRFPANDVLENAVNHSALIRTMCNGIEDFLIATGDFLPQSKPFQSLSWAKHFYSGTNISEPELALSVITNYGLISPAVNVYGIAAFSSAFSMAIESSRALQAVFNKRQLDVVSQAWGSAAEIFCASVNCYNLKGSTERMQMTISMTYNYLTRSRFIKAVANAYALSMIGMGTLNVNNADSSAKTLTTHLEILLNALPSDADLKDRLVVIFKVLEFLVPPSNDIAIQYSVFNHNLVVELFAAAPISSPIWF